VCGSSTPPTAASPSTTPTADPISTPLPAPRIAWAVREEWAAGSRVRIGVQRVDRTGGHAYGTSGRCPEPATTASGKRQDPGVRRAAEPGWRREHPCPLA